MKLTDHLHLLKIDFSIEVQPGKRIPRYVNILIILGNRITLVDTGVKGSEKAIYTYIEQQGYNPKKIDTIILSHSHPDHIGSAARIKEFTSCRVLAHRSEKDWVEDLDLQNRERPVPGFFSLVDTPVIIDDYLEDGEIINPAENMTLKIIESPGHSKGSINILFEEDRILFTADSIPLKNDIPNYDNYLALLASLEKIENNYAYDILLTSWTPPLTDSSEIGKILDEGREYIMHIDSLVKEFYNDPVIEDLKSCEAVVNRLGLPPFLVNALVDRAFRSHLL